VVESSVELGEGEDVVISTGNDAGETWKAGAT
jgi:hypothetical protein